MTDQMKVQAAVEVSTENAESALKRVGDAAGQMAERMQREGDKAGAAVDGIGSGASKSADEFSRAEGRIAASIKRATTNLELLGKTASQKLEFKIEERGLDKAKFDPLLSKLRELELRSQEAANAASASLGKVGVSAAQTAAALRGVRAQFTDIVVSLQSGQAPLTVFLQQGGQLKDMFGGAGAAAKALGGYVVGLLTPLNLAVAAIGGIGYAAYAGASEMDEFKKNLVLTGNVSGITTDKFNSMAAAMDNISGITRGAAAEALTAMAASGNIGATSIQKLTEAALKFEKAGGPAVAETAKQFEELGKSPVDASVKLSEKTHYLTLAVYEQIKALQDQGKTSEAAAVAQNAWADAIDKRTPEMVENLGHIENAWKGVKEAVAEAIDAAKDLGRVATPSERAAALHTQIGEIEKQLADPSTVLNRNRLKQDKQSLIAELQGLYVEIRKTHKDESAKTAAAAREQQQLAANVRWDKLAESQRSKREQYAEERKKLDADRAAELISEAKYRQAKADLARKYEEKTSTAKPKKSDEEKERERQAKLDAEDWARRVAYSQRVAAGMEKETDAIWAKVNAEVAAREAVGKSRVEIEARTLALMNEQLAWREALGLQDDETEQLKRNIAAQQALIAAVRDTDSAKQAESHGKAAAEAHRKAAAAAAAEWQKTVDRIDQTFHDGFVGMLEKGKADWDAFGKALATSFKTAVADEIYKMTIRPMVVQVVGAFSGQPGVAGQAQGIGGVISNVQSAYAGVSGGISNAANSFALSGMGQYLGLSTAGQAMGPPTASGAMGYTASGATMTGAGSTLSAVAAPATAALLGEYLMAEMAKAGWGMDNNRSAAGAYASNPYLYMAYQVGSRLFGHNRNISNDAAGIRGTFDLSGFSGENYQERSQKGGAFRSDKRWTDLSSVGGDMDKALDSMLKQAVAGVQTIGRALNVETEAALEGFSHTFALQLSENGDMSKAGEKIAAELKKVQDELATRLVPNIADFSRYGEAASDTFGRLNQEVVATDAILLAMGKDAGEAFGAVGLASIKAREDLIDLAGGLDALANKTQSFYANFYSSEEQLMLAAKQAQKVLTEGFAEIGQSIPATREAFRALVESQDLSTESGRKLWNSLLDLQDEFDAVADGADATAASMQAAADKLAAATTTAKQRQASLFDTFASDAQKLAAAQSIVNNTFASIGRQVPENASMLLQLAQSIDPATESGRALISALDSVSDAFAYVQTASAAAAAAAQRQSIDALKGQADAMQGQADATASAIEALAAGMGSLSPAVETLADKLTGIRDRLAASYSKDFASGLAGLNQSVGWRDQLSGARGNLADALFDAKLRLPGADVVGMLRGRESDLWSQMATATDKGQIAGLLQQTLMQRIQAEAGIQTAAQQDQVKRLQEIHDQTVSTLELQRDQASAQKTALQQQIGAWQKMLDVSQRLRDTVAGMAVDDLSSLNPFEQLASARQDFERALAAARGGDTEAASRLGDLGQSYRREGRDVYASSADYASIDRSVRAALESVAGLMDKSGQVSEASKQLALLDSQATSLSDQLSVLNNSYALQQQQAAASVNTAAREIELLSHLDDALSQSQTGVQSLIDSQLTGLQRIADAMKNDGFVEALQQQISGIPTEFSRQFVSYTKPDESREILRQQLAATKQQLDDEKSRYNGLVAMHKEQMEQLQDMNAKLRAIESNATLARAGA